MASLRWRIHHCSSLGLSLGCLLPCEAMPEEAGGSILLPSLGRNRISCTVFLQRSAPHSIDMKHHNSNPPLNIILSIFMKTGTETGSLPVRGCSFCEIQRIVCKVKKY
ncbi:uncharacterized protein ACIB01_016197 isoform 1-T1 [Guaruba guarouba]